MSCVYFNNNVHGVTCNRHLQIIKVFRRLGETFVLFSIGNRLCHDLLWWVGEECCENQTHFYENFCWKHIFLMISYKYVGIRFKRRFDDSLKNNSYNNNNSNSEVNENKTLPDTDFTSGHLVRTLYIFIFYFLQAKLLFSLRCCISIQKSIVQAARDGRNFPVGFSPIAGVRTNDFGAYRGYLPLSGESYGTYNNHLKF